MLLRLRFVFVHHIPFVDPSLKFDFLFATHRLIQRNMRIRHGQPMERMVGNRRCRRSKKIPLIFKMIGQQLAAFSGWIIPGAGAADG